MTKFALWGSPPPGPKTKTAGPQFVMFYGAGLCTSSPTFSGLVLSLRSSAQCSCSFSFFLLSRGQGECSISGKLEIGIFALNLPCEMYPVQNN